MARKTKAEQERLKELAKLIYISDTRISNKDIAGKVNVTQNTITKWIAEGNWKVLRTSLITTKQVQIRSYYKQLHDLDEHIRTRPILYDIPLSLLKPLRLQDSEGNVTYEDQEVNHEDFPILQSNFASSKEADLILKITSAINKLETETSISEVIEVGKDFIDFIAKDDYDYSKVITKLMDEFINHKAQ